jgi:hypothetical protein
MLFPTISKVRMRVEEYLVRLEIMDAIIADCSKQLSVSNSLLGQAIDFEKLSARCAHVHGVLNRALDGLYAKTVTRRELAVRLPNMEREVSQLENIVEQIRRSISASRAA